ncbi:MAG: hypothetical protein ACYCOU_01530 [Sulfobacillus sp.]
MKVAVIRGDDHIIKVVKVSDGCDDSSVNDEIGEELVAARRNWPYDNAQWINFNARVFYVE